LISFNSQANTFGGIIYDVCREFFNSSADTTSDPIDESIKRIQQIDQMELQTSSLDLIHVYPEKEGGFVAYSEEYRGAIGQGETVEETYDDLQKAIEALKEFYAENPNW
jgi:predicted RNase H-like HicB family nuclease